ncbi:MAG: hypothetical protein OEY94_09135 [Alphaproteobacteria bacterium]|nr:hypothetical protein [Alphaproteobacteria bacterium]
MSNNKIFNLKKPILVLYIFFLSIIPAYAQDNQESTPPSKPYTTTIESSGLYQQGNPSSLGNGLYHGADRKSIALLLQRSTHNTPWITQNILIRRLLLTQADTGILGDKETLSPENDLLAGRLKALLSLGMQNQAFELYTNIEDSEGHVDLHYYGILSMLMSNEKTLACVEIKTLFPKYKERSEWQVLNTYCSLSFSDRKISKNEKKILDNSVLKKIYDSTDFVFHYTPADFESLPLSDKAFLIAEKRIDLSKVTIKDLEDIPASHVQSLLSNKDISTSQKLALTYRGVSAGVIDPEILRTLYKDISKSLEEQKRDATDLEKIATLYTEIDKSQTKSSIIKPLREILEYANNQGHAALVPFVQILADTSIEKYEIGYKDIEMILHAAIIEGIELPINWSNAIAKMTVENEEEKKIRDRLIITSFLLSDPTKASKKNRSVIVDIIEQSQSTILNDVKNIDRQLSNYANVALSYENMMELSANKSYKVPSYELLNAIQDASNNSMASVILLSNKALEDQESGKTYAGTLDFIYKALNKIGLTKEARYILSEYIISAEE